MNLRLTHEELEVLNATLPIINPHDNSFTVANAHGLYLQKKFPGVNGRSVDLAKYDAARNDLNSRDVYEHITAWLLQQKLAKTALSNYKNGLKLTETGEILWAYGDCMLFYHSYNEIDEDEVSKQLGFIVANANKYGVFTINIVEPPVQVLNNIDIFSIDDAAQLKKVQDELSGKNGIIRKHQQSLITEKALQYLVSQGFVVDRLDLPHTDKFYREFTPEGRKLKELGSIDAYEEAKAKEQRESRFKEKMVEYNYWVAVSIAISTFAQAVYYVIQLIDGGAKPRIEVAMGIILVCVAVSVGLVWSRFQKVKK